MNISQHSFVPTQFRVGGVYNPNGWTEAPAYNSSGVSYCDGSNAFFIAAPVPSGYLRVYKSTWPSQDSGVYLNYSAFGTSQSPTSQVNVRFENDNEGCLFSCRQAPALPFDVRYLLYRDNTPMPVSLSLGNTFVSDVIDDEQELF